MPAENSTGRAGGFHRVVEALDRRASARRRLARIGPRQVCQPRKEQILRQEAGELFHERVAHVGVGGERGNRHPGIGVGVGDGAERRSRRPHDDAVRVRAANPLHLRGNALVGRIEVLVVDQRDAFRRILGQRDRRFDLILGILAAGVGRGDRRHPFPTALAHVAHHRGRHALGRNARRE